LNMVAKKLSKEIGMTEEDLVARFLERQEECNTAVSDFLAIPHIVIDGEDTMFLTIVRCREGIKVTESENAVKALFLIGGTKEHRILHLKTIASIATLIGQKDFQVKWENVENIIELKNLMILSGRKRFF
jgi:basic amino acid/polyamine antiporter, APA family